MKHTFGIGISSDEKYYFISSSDHNTSEQYYFNIEEKNLNKINSKKEKVFFTVLVRGMDISTYIQI